MVKISYADKIKNKKLSEFTNDGEGFEPKIKRDPVTGVRKKKENNKLNSGRRLSRYEMDELFLDEEE